MRGLARVDNKVVSQGERLNQDLNKHCCSHSRLCLAKSSLTFAIDSQTIPEWSV